MQRLIIPLALSLASLPVRSQQTLTIDPDHTAVVFSWAHRGFSHPVARLERLHGKLRLDPTDLSKSSVSVVFPLEGLHTAVEALDRRLKGREFFELAKYPEITFRSTKVESTGPQALRVTGDLTAHGVTKPVVLGATINRLTTGSDHKLTAGFDAVTTLRRSDFNVNRYVPLASDEVSIHITLEATQP